MIDVSIIIPTYNRLWSLPKAINSCKVTDLSIEIIIVDDGSTDGTIDWLEQQTGIIVIFQPNQGKDWAVNKAFNITKGKYIRFLDSDDWLLPKSTDELFEHAEHYQLDVTCAGYQIFEDETFKRESKWMVCDDFLAQQLGECDSSHYSAFLFRREFISDVPHRQEFFSRDDREFIIEVALKRPKTGYIENPTFAHRQHKNERLQLSDGLKGTVNDFAILLIYRRCFEFLERQNNLTQRYKNASTNILWHLAHWIAKTHLNEAEVIYKWVYQLNPNFIPIENLSLARMYKFLGFKTTEKLLRLRRLLK